MRIKFAKKDGGTRLAVAVQIGSFRRGWYVDGRALAASISLMTMLFAIAYGLAALLRHL